eukprot:9767221-Alexandrium_andersonii.AAC.1
MEHENVALELLGSGAQFKPIDVPVGPLERHKILVPGGRRITVLLLRGPSSFGGKEGAEQRNMLHDHARAPALQSEG